MISEERLGGQQTGSVLMGENSRLSYEENMAREMERLSTSMSLSAPAVLAETKIYFSPLAAFIPGV